MAMRLPHEGYVLFVVLIFLQLFAVLFVQSVHHLSLNKRELAQYRQVAQSRDMAEKIISTLDHEGSLSCLRDLIPPHSLKIKTVSWWSALACRGVYEHVIYYYFEEKLGRDTCASIEGHENEGTQYYRTSVLLKDNWKTIVQETSVVPDRLSIDCQSSIKRIKRGRQMMRFL